MRPLIAVAAVLLLAIGCEADRRDAAKADATAAMTESGPPAPETFALGTEISATGAVPQDAAGETFIRGGEVFLSVDMSGASTDQTIEVKWIDPEGRVLRHDRRRARQGMRHVPFSSGATSRWRPGEHRAVIVIDGRRVSEKPFVLTNVSSS